MQPEPTEWQDFFRLVKRRTGLDLNDYKQDQIRRRIICIAQAKKASNLQEFWKHLDSQETGIQWFLDKFAINVSELFRNPEKWEELQTQILPDLIARSGYLKCWSAGSSYGAEAYTLAAILHKNFPGQHQILCTDIDQAALCQLEEGLFAESDMARVPANYCIYFQQERDKYRVHPDLKRYIQFRQENLLSAEFEGGFDLIACRNVVIYLTDEAKVRLNKALYKALKPGGVLFVGSTERVFSAKELGFTTSLPFFYQKPMEGITEKWRNAS